MEAGVQRKIVKKLKLSKKAIVISMSAFVLLILILSIEFAYAAMSSDKVHNGVYVNNINASGLTNGQIKDLLEKKYQNSVKDLELTVNIKGKSEKISFSDLGVTYDIQSTADQAFKIGRTGNFFQKVFEMAKTSGSTIKLPMSYKMDEKKLNEIIDSIGSKVLSPVKEAELKISDDKVVLCSGHHGEVVDRPKFVSHVKKAIESGSSASVEASVITGYPKKIDVEDFYKQIVHDPVNAKVTVENNAVKIIPSIPGRSIEKSELKPIADELDKSEDSEKVLPVKFTQSKVNSNDIKPKLFRDTMGSMSTQFYTGNENDSNRGNNIRIAVSKINGKILGPGQVFSFNDVVGPRTADGGYKTAHSYVDGDIVNSLGGGICQVSSTLYNAVVYSDLDVLERSNHLYTVGYIPLGRDAAVSYGDVDFKFKNSTNWPVRVEGWVTAGNQIVFSIVGTNETPGRTVILNPQTVKYLDAPDKVTLDPTLPEGTEVVDRDAISGCIVDTYRTVKVGDKVIKDGKYTSSTYKALGRSVRKGTKKAAAPKPVTPPKPVPSKPAGTSR